MFLNKNLTHMKTDGNASESLPLKFLYIENFFTQISLNWMVFDNAKKNCLHFNSEHSDHWFIPYHPSKFC